MRFVLRASLTSFLLTSTLFASDPESEIDEILQCIEVFRQQVNERLDRMSSRLRGLGGQVGQFIQTRSKYDDARPIETLLTQIDSMSIRLASCNAATMMNLRILGSSVSDPWKSSSRQ